MKFIFDFDDVLFYTTKHRLEHMFPLLEKSGISPREWDEYYKKTRLDGFSLRSALLNFLSHTNIDQDELYEKTMHIDKKFLNTDIFELLKKLGKENCFLITHGGEEFQKDKIKRTGVESFFSRIIVLVGSKKQAVEEICEKYSDEEVIFIDDKPQYFEDLNFEKYPNLKTILYTGQDLSSLTNTAQ